jgi:hypothetical protein
MSDSALTGADHDPTRLAVRTLVERVRGEVYRGDLVTQHDYALDPEQAAEAVLAFALSENTRTVLRRNERYAQLLHCAMLQLCDHGVTANSSALVREIRDLLGGRLT